MDHQQNDTNHNQFQITPSSLGVANGAAGWSGGLGQVLQGYPFHPGGACPTYGYCSHCGHTQPRPSYQTSGYMRAQ